VINWMTHFKTPEGFATVPPALAGDIEKRFGLDPVPHCNTIDHSPQGIEQFTTAMRARVAQRTQFALELIAAHTYDLVAIGFGESHCVGHQCYHLHVAQGNAGTDPTMRVYRAIDRAVGQIFAACRDGYSIVLGLVEPGEYLPTHMDGSEIANHVLAVFGIGDPAT
jgi:hypothetical protein